LELESHDFVDPVIWRCRKYRQLARRVGRFVAYFPLNISMVHSSTLTVTIDDEHLTRGGFSLNEIVRFGSLEFIVNCFGSPSLSPNGSDSGTVFMGMTRNGSLSLRTILGASTDEFYMASSGEGSLCIRKFPKTTFMTPVVLFIVTFELTIFRLLKVIKHFCDICSKFLLW
jgi:hypothetical protein